MVRILNLKQYFIEHKDLTTGDTMLTTQTKTKNEARKNHTRHNKRKSKVQTYR